MNFQEFYENRKEKFEERFNEILEATFENLELRIRQNYALNRDIQNSEISWEIFGDLDQIIVSFI